MLDERRRAFADRDPRPPRSWAWRTFTISAVVLLVLFFALGQYWQNEIRNLMDDRPHRLRVRTNRPREVAGGLLARRAAVGTYWCLPRLSSDPGSPIPDPGSGLSQTSVP